VEVLDGHEPDVCGGFVSIGPGLRGWLGGWELCEGENLRSLGMILDAKIDIWGALIEKRPQWPI
jgi:hypothetical protein